ncbi:uncharacterized protein isoform X1 [Rhodnius prolixus]
MSETELACSTDCGEQEVDSRMQVDLNSNEETCDNDESNQVVETGLNTNYDSSDGAIPMHRCEGCDYESMSRGALARHVASCRSDRHQAPSTPNSASKMFECDVCNMRFSNGANMRRHKMRHTGVKPYECRVCGKRFFRKDHLAEHTTTHAKSLPWSCPICGRGFQRQIAMRAHFQNEHVGGNEGVKSCPLCAYRATSMKSLRVHFYNRHGIDLDRPSNGLTGDRNLDNATPPMHFLTPHIELSLPESPFSPQQVGEFHTEDNHLENEPESPRGSPESGDSNTPSSSLEQQITVKTEPGGGQDEDDMNVMKPVNLTTRPSPLKCLLGNNGGTNPTTNGTITVPAIQIPPRHLDRPLCRHCGIHFPDRTLYFMHKGCHAEGNPWKCNICGEQCSNVYDFNSHLLSKNHQ